MSQQPTVIYFDNNATTRIAPEVTDAMIPMLREFWGNPSSAYAFGSQVHGHVEKARAQVAALINADPKEIVFTSCGTESNNSAIQSALATHPSKRHIVTSSVEHSANIKFCKFLQTQGVEITFLPVFIVFAFLASIGPSLWITALNVKYRDFRYVVPFIVQVGIYVSPVGFSSQLVPEEWRGPKPRPISRARE